MGDSNGHAEKMQQSGSSQTYFIALNIFKRYKNINNRKEYYRGWINFGYDEK
jgi:hypothetical protein